MLLPYRRFEPLFCSPWQHRLIGMRGFFLFPDHSKLIDVDFSDDSNETITIRQRLIYCFLHDGPREQLSIGSLKKFPSLIFPTSPGYLEVLWGMDADPKVLVASVALVTSDLTQPRFLGYVRPDITVSWEFLGYVRPVITKSWELSVMSELTQPRILGCVRSDITESWEFSVMSDLT